MVLRVTDWRSWPLQSHLFTPGRVSDPRGFKHQPGHLHPESPAEPWERLSKGAYSVGIRPLHCCSDVDFVD